MNCPTSSDIEPSRQLRHNREADSADESTSSRSLTTSQAHIQLPDNQPNHSQSLQNTSAASWCFDGTSGCENRPDLHRRPASHPFTAKETDCRDTNPRKRRLPPEVADGPSNLKRLKTELSKDNKRRQLLDIPSFSKNTPEEKAVSPLFFSHHPRKRPPLPRFSSSEAGAFMMKKATLAEDQGKLRLAKLVRGSIHYGSTSPRATSTPSGRLLPDRQSAPTHTSAEERGVSSAALETLEQAGILELLDQDDRLVFILDLETPSNYQPGPLNVVFANGLLRASRLLLESIHGRIADDPIGLGSAATFAEFKTWATSFVKNHEAMDIALPAFTFANVTWTCSAVKKRYRVFYASPPNSIASVTSNPPSAGTPGLTNYRGSSESSHLPSEHVRESQAEPADYFGNVTMPSSDSNMIPEVSPRRLSRAIETLRSFNSSSKSSSSKKSRLRVESSLSSGSALHEDSPLDSRASEAILGAATAGHIDSFDFPNGSEQLYFDWTRLPLSQALPRHIQFAKSFDWASTSLGPPETWSAALRSNCNLLMASPHPAAMYWGEDLICLYNEPYILLAGQKHPHLMGMAYRDAWKEIWDQVKDAFAAAKASGQSIMKDDDCLFLERSGFLEETYFSWSLIPLVGDDGTVAGLFNPAFEKTRRKVAERRMLTLREVGETTASAREVKGFWDQVLKGLAYNPYDTPFVLLYSVADDNESEDVSIHSNSISTAKQCLLEGTLPHIPEDHPAAPRTMDLKTDGEGFSAVFSEAMSMDKPVLLETATGTLDPELIAGIECRGFPEKPRAAVVCPIHPTTGDSIIGFLVMGVNPRRPYDDDYNLFVQLLSRQLATSMASVVLFEEEIRRGQRAAKLAALDRIELSEQLAARTEEVKESETRFTRMAEFAPVGMFIANSEGRMTFTNDTFCAISGIPKYEDASLWMGAIHDEDRDNVEKMWHNLIYNKMSMLAEFRFKRPWEDPDGNIGETWVLGSAYPEKDTDGGLKSAFGCITNISQQKRAEDFQKKRMEEAVEVKRQQSNFIDMTSHEMRNPLSAILQCADEISGSLLEFKANPGNYEIPASLIDSNIDAAQTIALCANHQTRIVSDVLTLSKLDSALLLVTPVDCQPAVIVQQVLKMFEGELHTADIKLEFKIDPTFEELKVDWVRMDPSRILQVLINLTTNAIKFTSSRDHRKITIRLSASLEPPSESDSDSSCVSYIPARSKRTDLTEGRDWGNGETVYLLFSVKDTGKGLSEDEKKLLFLRFSQASPKTHVQYGGSGLGLFISRELVELQGGEIGVSSERGKGSTFAFYIQIRRSSEPKDGTGRTLPAALRKPASARTSKTSPIVRALPPIDKLELAVAPPPPVLGHIKVLIVEDNLVNQRVLSKQLRKLGCIVNVANHGGECLEHLQKTRFWRENDEEGLELSTILMDLEMPVMDGLTCTKRIRELQRLGEVVSHVPIIAVSANARSAHIEDAIQAGMDDVVSKPFRIPELIPKMEALIEKYELPTRQTSTARGLGILDEQQVDAERATRSAFMGHGNAR